MPRTLARTSALHSRPSTPRAGMFELSVLFADVRGFAGFAEQRDPEEVFKAISRHVLHVAAILVSHGARILDVSGDGMLAIFGYSSPVADKECAALLAALELVRTGTVVDGLSVGVGIATGPVYVGAIDTHDCSFWSAMGDTTNLASRLQSLTRELDAEVVIDASTFSRARAHAVDFVELRKTMIRGRARAEDLFALPRASIVDGVPLSCVQDHQDLV